MTVAAAYGFCGEALPPHEWGVDALIRHPSELQTVLKLSPSRA
jgi:phosphoglycolate phosphatase